MKIALLNHGCAKNLVDAELMLGLLAEKGHEITMDDSGADIVVVNTCSFIHDAEKESVRSILGAVNSGKKVIVTGCLPQKYKDELKEAIPEIAGMAGTSDLREIAGIVEKIAGEAQYTSHVSENPDYIYPEAVARRQITVGASSYIKIADGCNYRCGYCIIPQLRGKYHSRPVENIIAEAKSLAQKGVAEIVLIAQDTTSYGQDLYGELALPELLEELNKIEDLSWIRVMYAYPSNLTDELLDTIARLDKVVKYIDLPLQHSNPEILHAMRRPVFDYSALIKKIRAKIPGAAVRTAFITGYPGETEEQFNDLYEFVKRMRFEKMGVFEYSREKNTYSYGLKPQISAKAKKQRRNKLMALQQGISREINETYIGKTLPCIVEGFTDDGVILRSQYDAPEIDGMVYARTEKPVVPGDIEEVLIETVDAYDLFGVVV
ncbi:MAG: 30S ribosomal protein S12 methylthiotransferase RimO [Heliobacteriaceae bacterium]|jgi:ribosomal protein S12 methylthiotransferase|nr:30S ribosomal protein S12 methylthiotransferase RimO [Heliobacteriaceae bacterium]